MSLTSELKNSNSLVSRFFNEKFPNTLNLVKDCNKSLRNIETIRPDVPASPMEYALLGTAIDYRFRYYFPATDYRELAAWKGANMISREDSRFLSGPNGSELYIPSDLISEFFDQLQTLLEELQPAGRQMESDNEAMICRYCIVLALFEQIFRSGPHPESLLFKADLSSVEDLLHLSNFHWIEDLSAQSNLFYDNFMDRLSSKYVLNPTFDGSQDVGGADADIILEDCLIDFKATIDPKIQKQWVYQLLGYSLLDYSDAYGLKRVAIYYSRQGVLKEWWLDDLIRKTAVDYPYLLSQLRSNLAELIARQ